MSQPNERSQHLFIVRMWQEPSQVSEEGQWRGSVEHVPTGQRLYFVSLADLTDFISWRLCSENTEEETKRG